MSTRVTITIDDLVLRGVPPERRFEVAESLTRTLDGLVGAWLAAGGVFPARHESGRRLPGIRLPERNAAALGEAVGHSTFGLLTGVRNDV